MHTTPRRSKVAQDFGREYPFAPASDVRDPKQLGEVLFELTELGELSVPVESADVDSGRPGEAQVSARAMTAADAAAHLAITRELGSADDISTINGVPYVR